MEMYFILTGMFQKPGYPMAYFTKYGVWTVAASMTRENAFKEILGAVARSVEARPETITVMFFSLEPNASPAGTPNAERD